MTMNNLLRSEWRKAQAKKVISIGDQDALDLQPLVSESIEYRDVLTRLHKSLNPNQKLVFEGLIADRSKKDIARDSGLSTRWVHTLQGQIETKYQGLK